MPRSSIRLGEHGTLIEPRARCILTRGGEDEAADAAPQRGAEAHRARLARREKLVSGLVVALKREAPNVGLRHHERDDLGMSARIVEPDNAVRSDPDQSPRLRLEHGRAKRPAGFAKNVLARQINGETAR